LSADPLHRCCSAVFFGVPSTTRANDVADLIQFVAAPLTGMNLLETAMTCPRSLAVESAAKLAPEVQLPAAGLALSTPLRFRARCMPIKLS
jgi:hypothetical protein